MIKAQTYKFLQHLKTFFHNQPNTLGLNLTEGEYDRYKQGVDLEKKENETTKPTPIAILIFFSSRFDSLKTQKSTSHIHKLDHIKKLGRILEILICYLGKTIQGKL